MNPYTLAAVLIVSMTINGLLGALAVVYRRLLRAARLKRRNAVQAAGLLRVDIETLNNEFLAVQNDNGRLRAELDIARGWNAELIAARAEVDELVNGPLPRRNPRPKHDAWVSQMKAVWLGPTRTPPHEAGGLR